MQAPFPFGDLRTRRRAIRIGGAVEQKPPRTRASRNPIDDIREVSNCVDAMMYGLERLKELPLSLRLIREMHGRLLQSGRGGTKSPGEFRRSQSWIGGTRPGNALFVPPPVTELDATLAALEAFMHEDQSRLPALIKAGLLHVQFETIHPFLDGNGRVGRPAVTIEIVSDNALADMVSEGFDAGMRFGETVAQDMISVPIGPRQRSAVVATPDFFARHFAPSAPEQLRDLPCLRMRFGSGRFYDWEFERGGIEFQVAVQGPLVLSDQGHLLQAALAGVGVAYLFETQIETHVAEGRLIRVLEEWCPYYPGFHLYFPSRRQMPATLRAFIDFVRGERVVPK